SQRGLEELGPRPARQASRYNGPEGQPSDGRRRARAPGPARHGGGRDWRGVRADRKESCAMQLHVNPHELILIGENSFLRLSTGGCQTASTGCSQRRVLWSPAGAGHALFVDGGVVGGVRVYSDSVPLVRFLQREIEHLLHRPFGDAGLPVLAAAFEREGT